jgi:hypothetical protein
LPALPAEKLLMNEYFRDETTGSFTTILESYTNNNEIFTINLLVMVFENEFMRTNISIQSNRKNTFNYITEINVFDPRSGESVNIKYDGTVQSSMEIIHQFLSIISIFYDIDKLFYYE